MPTLFEVRDAKLQRAAFNVLESSLRRSGSKVLLVFDRFGQEIADAFLEAAADAKKMITAVYVPAETQEALDGIERWTPLLMLLSASDALITILSDSQTSVPFRLALLNAAVKVGLPVVHMPGVTDDMFLAGALDVDFTKIDQDVRRVASLLTSANKATVSTRSSHSGVHHSLEIRLEGRRAYADAGIAFPGEIINIPTGEAYISVLEDSAEGTIVVNGSFPDRNLPNGREVILHFRDGRLDLQLSQFQKDGTGQYCRSILAALETSDPSGIRIGELGIGLNPFVASVEGRTIVDEKTFGTAHVAIGSNAPFGGASLAPYHLDLVFHPVSISLDGESVQIPWRSR